MKTIERLRELYKQNGLNKEDVYKDKRGFTIITRTGIEKIQAKNKIDVAFELKHISPDQKYCTIKAVATMGTKSIETFGEASPDNCRQSYKVMMAEKRALSRAVLKITGMYEHGVYGQDEIDDIQKEEKKIDLSFYMAKVRNLSEEKRKFFNDMVKAKQDSGELTQEILDNIIQTI